MTAPLVAQDSSELPSPVECITPLNILYLYKDYFPVLGGIENHIRILAEGLRARGVNTQVLVTNTARSTTHETLNGVPVTKTSRLLNVSSAPVSLAFYPWLYRLEKDIDIAHAHAPYPPGELGQLLLGRSRRFVVTYHSDIVKQRVLGFFYRPFLRQTLRSADLIAVSNPTYIQTSPFLSPHADKCRVVHFGIDVDLFSPTAKSMAQAAALRSRYADRPLLLFVGRLRHYKGLDVLLAALPAIANAHLLVIGVGPMEDAWRKQAEETGLADRVTFLGEATEAEKVAAYQAAQLFVLPSTNRAETLGIVQLEAMASGLPLVCTELGTGTSYVNQEGRTGFVVPPNDPVALAGAINRLLADAGLRHRFGEAGRLRAQQEFSHQSMIQNMLAFYAEAAHD
ncbi:MAG: glycosyltransferase [Caldilineaceae bacterium]|nr:glycosyltransferase [Caldilineaceae bacterium]